MIDIHTHILPGIDDGSTSLEESIIMASMAVKSGVDTVVVTPHGWNGNTNIEKYWAAYRQLEIALSDNNIPLKLVSGMEILLTEGVLDAIENKNLLSINDTKYLLVEFNFEEEAWVAEYYLQMLQEAGYNPIVAHPERYRFMHRNPELAYEWVRQDYVLQANKDSILGRFGSRCQRLAVEFLNHNLIQVVASDTHGIERRTPRMNGVQALLENEFSPIYANMLLEENPKRIIHGEEVITFAPRPF